jgi:tRNA-binding EMAP/Myf-like protein
MPNYSNYQVGVITELTELKAPLRKCLIDVGDSAGPISVVTNASNVRLESRVVVARVGAVVPATADAEDGTVISKTTVGGETSEGMLCDAKMLGWNNNEGVAVYLSDEFAVGSEPPATKPGAPGAAAAAELPASNEPGLFEKKLTKEEKKALAQAKREAKKAAKAAE